jgi:glutamine amidotransferase
MIAIVDYQMGNLRSVQKAFEYKGCEAAIVDDVEGIRGAEAVVLPGVGAFGDCYRELKSRGFIDPLLEHIGEGRPFLGICLGLQVLLTASEESGGTPGLRVVPGQVKRFDDGALKVPHMGWNRVRYPAAGRNNGGQCPLFEGIPDGTYFYFVHSYYVAPEDWSVVAGVTDYGVTFASAVWRGNMFATQFHPEKSQDAGLKLIENFGEVVKRAAHARA